MASRRFFGYDPYDYYYTTPSSYTYPYYHNPAAFPKFESTEPAIRYPSRRSSARAPARNGGADSLEAALAEARARNGGAFFQDAESPVPVMREDVHPRPRSSRLVSVPVDFVGYDFEPEPKAAGLHAPAAALHQKRSPSAEEAAVKVQAAARGLLARKMMREVRAVEREAEVVAARLAAEAETLRVDPRGRIGVGEELMRLLLRLDAVRGVREFRKRVTKKVLALQDAVDALEDKPAQATNNTPAAAESLAVETFEMSEPHAVESAMAPEMPQSREQSVQIGANIAADSLAAETTAEMDMQVDGGRAEEADSVATETIAAESKMVFEEAGSVSTETIAAESKMVFEEAAEAEGEWEMVTGADAFAGEPKAQQHEAAGEESENKTTTTEAASADGLDAKKVMEMMAAMCEQSAQQCALIGALAERVDTLERAVRRVEEADRRRRRIKKIKKEGRINSKAARSFYSD